MGKSPDSLPWQKSACIAKVLSSWDIRTEGVRKQQMSCQSPNLWGQCKMRCCSDCMLLWSWISGAQAPTLTLRPYVKHIFHILYSLISFKRIWLEGSRLGNKSQSSISVASGPSPLAPLSTSGCWQLRGLWGLVRMRGSHLGCSAFCDHILVFGFLFFSYA